MAKSCIGTVGFISLGCAKALVDSETMLGRIAAQGFALTADHENADVVVINTCGFLEAAREESLSTIKSMVRRKADGQVRRVVVAGCMVAEHKDLLLERVPQVDALIGVNDREELAGVLTELRTSGDLGRGIHISDPDERGTVYDDRGRFRLTPRHYAYLRVSEGCDHTCSFCIIPKIRGRHRSKPVELILEEAHELASDGAKELIVIAQDTTAYGLDLYGEKRLATLLARLATEVDGVEWIRVMYAYPNEVTPDLIETMAAHERILPYLDMPIQHISKDVLARMRRGGSRELIERWITHFRKAIPNFRLRTTLIAGFPGETQAQHEELVEWVSEGWADRLGCFAYSPEKDSQSHALDGHLPEPERLERQGRVMEAARDTLFAKNAKLVGKRLRVLVDGESLDPKYPYAARTWADAPDVDCRVMLRGDTPLKPGDFIETEIASSQGYDLLGRAVASAALTPR